MRSSTKSYLVPAVAIFATLAVAFSGFGGLVAEERYRNLFAAGAGFWLLMLFVPWVFVSSREWPYSAHSAAAAAFGALSGICFSLCFASHGGWGVFATHTASGALIGFVSYWLALLRAGSLWRNG